MAVGIRIKLAGISGEQFDAAHDKINPDRTPPKGQLFHASGPIDGGWGIVDRRFGRLLAEPEPERHRYPSWAAVQVAVHDLNAGGSD